MSRRIVFWLAWFTWALYLVIAISTLLFKMTNAPSELLSDAFYALVLLAFATVGALIASRRPQNPIGWIFCISTLLWALGVLMLEYAVYALITMPGSLPAGALMGVLGGWARGMGWFPLLTFLLLLFPNGRLPSSRWRPLALLIMGLLAVFTITSLLAPSSSDIRLTAVRNPIGIPGANGLFDLLTTFTSLGLLATIIPCIVAVVLRFRRSRGDERQQLKWFAYGTTLSLLMLIAIVVFVFAQNGAPDVLFSLAVVCIPISAGIAILRYRLYAIDILINRTLVYGALTVSVVGVYVLVVGYLGALFRTGGNLLISLVAAALVAVLFQPLRSWLQRGVNRLMYGQRDEPYAVVAQLGRRLAGTLAPEAVLPAVVETVAQALKLPYAAISLKQGDTFRTVAIYGAPVAGTLTLPLSYQAEPVGQLTLGPRQRGDAFTPADTRLLEDLARQVGVAAHAVQLTADLQRSRERLVTAREEERRRLRRDLHDGLGPALATLSFKAEAARDLARQQPTETETLLDEVIAQAHGAISDIRRLVYDLRPPALDDLGLIGAIRAQIPHHMSGDLNIVVDAPASLPPLPAATEVAAYRIVQEALTNILRHADAHQSRVSLRLTEDALHVEITDDGVGLAADRPLGVGSISMRERAEELGGSCVVESLPSGGARVWASLPRAGVRD
jgi:signal transduction histidine kinase